MGVSGYTLLLGGGLNFLYLHLLHFSLFSLSLFNFRAFTVPLFFVGVLHKLLLSRSLLTLCIKFLGFVGQVGVACDVGKEG